MRTPFDFGGSVDAVHFVNREAELEMLTRNFHAAQNTVLISPRRWGKSSLVNRAIALATAPGRGRPLRVVRLDLLAVRTEGQLLSAYLEATLRAFGGTPERAIAALREAAAVLVPKVSFTAGTDAEFKIGFDWRGAPADRPTILELPERLAERRGERAVVAIDEFQQIAELDDAPGFDAVLRSHWQHHRRVCYCLYGSKRHMMLKLFGSYGAPFYHFADAHVLEKIGRAHWMGYIVDRFARFRKTISREQADRLAAYVDDHSHYVQQIAQLAFGLTRETCDAEVVDAAYEQLLYQLEPFFSQQLAPLSRTQIGFLHAVFDGQQAFSSREVLDGYGLGSSANASKLKGVMQEREFVYPDRKGRFAFVDPVFRGWLARRWS